MNADGSPGATCDPAVDGNLAAAADYDICASVVTDYPAETGLMVGVEGGYATV